jgi:ABC-2 type transport system ATP-binding protein
MRRMSEMAVRVEGLVKKFGSVVALDGIDFEVQAGSVFGLLGPNGAGKTTAVRILTTILRPDAGHAEILGLDVVKDEVAVRHHIGLAGQFAAIDPNLTGRENLRLVGRLAQVPKAQIPRRADELLRRFELTDAADRPSRTYSGGMKRRLDVAAALVSRPLVLFLDEPTTGLDLHSRNELWDMIRELVADGTTVLLTTQYLEEADQLAGRVAVVDGGHVIANDSPKALKAQLGSTVIEMSMGDETRAARAMQLLAGNTSGRAEQEGSSVHVTTDEGPSLLMQLLRTLDAENLAPTSLAVREPSLDDVFLALTGHHAETAPDDGTPAQAQLAGARSGGEA